MAKSGLLYTTTALGLLVIFGLSGCCAVSSHMPSSKEISEAEAKLLEKGIKPEASRVCLWPIFDIKSEVRPLLVEGEPVGTERRTKVCVLLLFRSSSTKQEKLPGD